MEVNITAPVGEPASAPAGEENNPHQRKRVIDAPRVKHATPQKSLPSRADRRKIIEQAHVVLAEARAVAKQAGRAPAPHTAEPAE